ncbi:hypothetical protein HDU67_007011 [Dinochytrium kinnereticum]|nr:hypothetical protein HDU67_007011 [Dinochytrium kinnereticum]
MKSDMDKMAVLEHRLHTYLPGVVTKKGWTLKVSRRKDAPTSQRGPNLWKQKKLATSGFHFDPTPTHPHRTSCHLCGPLRDPSTGLDRDIDPDDKDLFSLHTSTCPFKIMMVDGLAWVAASRPVKAKRGKAAQETAKTGHEPWGEAMRNARVKTFCGFWPYHSDETWRCTAEKIAAAGMYFKPSKDEPDYAECVYCNLGLAGWESNDDPMVEHQKRSKDCIIFKAPVDPIEEEDEDPFVESVVSKSKPAAAGKVKAETVAKKPAKGRGRPLRSKAERVPEDSDENPLDEPSIPTDPTTNSPTPTKKQASPPPNPPARGRRKKEEVVIESPAPTKSKKVAAAKTKATTLKRGVVIEDSDHPVRKRTRKAAADEGDVEDGEEVGRKGVVKGKGSGTAGAVGRKTRGKKVVEEAVAVEEEKSHMDDSVVVDLDAVDDPVIGRVEINPSITSEEPFTKTPTPQSVSPDDDMEIEPPEPPTPTPTLSSKTSFFPPKPSSPSSPPSRPSAAPTEIDQTPRPQSHLQPERTAAQQQQHHHHPATIPILPIWPALPPNRHHDEDGDSSPEPVAVVKPPPPPLPAVRGSSVAISSRLRSPPKSFGFGKGPGGGAVGKENYVHPLGGFMKQSNVGTAGGLGASSRWLRPSSTTTSIASIAPPPSKPQTPPRKQAPLTTTTTTPETAKKIPVTVNDDIDETDIVVKELLGHLHLDEEIGERELELTVEQYLRGLARCEVGKMRGALAVVLAGLEVEAKVVREGMVKGLEGR